MAQAETGNGAAKVPKKRAKRKTKEQRRTEKVALVLALEIKRLMEDVIFRKGLLVEVWSRMRDRAPMVRVLRSRYDEVSASDLVLLTEEVILSVDRFYRQIDEFRMYVETTEDMPHALENQYALYARQLESLGVETLHGLMEIHGRNLNPAAEQIKGGELLEFGTEM